MNFCNTMTHKRLAQFVGSVVVIVFISHLFVSNVDAACSTIPYCASCNLTNSTVCDYCFLGYGLDANGRCANCSTIPRCIQCSSVVPANCTKCSSTNYTVSSEGTCQPCATNCRSCAKSGPGSCDLCVSGYGFDNTTKTCQVCQAEHCSACSPDPSVCTTCQTGYTRTSTSPPTCTKCDSNCTYCSINAPTCNPGSCIGGYGLNNATQKCEPCADPNCYFCDGDINQCKTCKPGFNFYQNSSNSTAIQSNSTEPYSNSTEAATNPNEPPPNSPARCV